VVSLSENEKIAEEVVSVRVPSVLKEVMKELEYLELRGDKIRLFNMTDVLREALLKGVRLMLLEKEVVKTMILNQEAMNGAKRIYASLKERERKAQASQISEALAQTSVKDMEEENKEIEEEEEEEEEEETED